MVFRKILITFDQDLSPEVAAEAAETIGTLMQFNSVPCSVSLPELEESAELARMDEFNRLANDIAMEEASGLELFAS